MPGWKEVLFNFTADVEGQFDRLKYGLTRRMGFHEPVMILPFRGFGDHREIFLKGRVLENKGITQPDENDSVWENLVNMYRRFESDEIPYARVLARFQGLEQEFQANEEGFFDVRLQLPEPPHTESLWAEVQLELLSPLQPGRAPATAIGHALIPPEQAAFGVISDIDDTVLMTDATHLVRMARNVFLGNARTRLPFKGVAAFYRALFHGPRGDDRQGDPVNPLFFVSSSPWNIYDMLTDFFHLQDIPIGPVMFLRDWGISREASEILGHRSHKLTIIRKILDVYRHLPFILVGDSGQEDPEIYAEVVSLYPNRIPAIYIRNVSRDLKRPEAIRELAKQVAEAGSTLILADDTLPMAEHAIEQGWISAAALPGIREEKEKDEAPPTPLEKALGEEPAKEPEAPTVVVEGKEPEDTQEAVEEGAIEEALTKGEETTEKPPTVVVEGDEEKKPANPDQGKPA